MPTAKIRLKYKDCIEEIRIDKKFIIQQRAQTFVRVFHKNYVRITKNTALQIYEIIF